MKKFLLVFSFLLSAFIGNAQKYAIVDTRYILDRLPEYKTAQQQLDVIAATWQLQIDSMQTSLDRMYREFDAEQIMLTAELKKRKEDQLFAKEKEAREAALRLLFEEVCTARPDLIAALMHYGMLIERDMPLDTLVMRHFGHLPDPQP